jgi:coenzyme F420-reducing hydrogenase alpha subunit
MSDIYDAVKGLSETDKVFLDQIRAMSRRYKVKGFRPNYSDLKSTLPEYVICAATETVYTDSEEIVLVHRDDFDVHKYEPIAGDSDKAEAEKKFAEVKKLGVREYLNRAFERLKTDKEFMRTHHLLDDD